MNRYGIGRRIQASHLQELWQVHHGGIAMIGLRFFASTRWKSPSLFILRAATEGTPSDDIETVKLYNSPNLRCPLLETILPSPSIPSPSSGFPSPIASSVNTFPSSLVGLTVLGAMTLNVGYNAR